MSTRMDLGQSTAEPRLSFIRYCTTCDHPEGDHGGRAGWHGPRRGPCFRCDCQRFTQESDQKDAA